ncbi:MAG: iron-containing alcohol dehydrogenase [Armatimonadota bacterium]|nr:iron-containing alcohol dehydrogenase [Armatimonadota bacterium]
MEPEILYGENLLPDALPSYSQWVIVVAPPVRDRIAPLFPAHTQWVEALSLDEAHLQSLWRQLAPAEAVFGVGGGVAIDTAKYLAWRAGLPLYLAPSVVSVDAFLTESIAVRRKGRVHYLGEVYAQRVLVDFSLIRSAPSHVNRAGAGDILSIHTALWDWRAAAEARHAVYNAEVAQQSRTLLDRLEQAAEEIHAVTSLGIRTLVESYAEEVRLCRQVGHSRPEEGSEHFWAYNVEYLYPRAYVHGELVALGVLLMAQLQQNQPEWVAELVRRLGVRYRPEEVGLSPEEVVHSLVTARQYAEEDDLAFSVINLRPLTLQQAEEMVQWIAQQG